jgi:L-threonylcarbamoyladenylate synthase
VVVVPTDTVYGLAVMPGIPGAVDRLFAVKGRPEDKPIPVLAATGRALLAIAQFDAAARRVADRYWPGPVTLVLRRADNFNVPLGPRVEATIAVRVPDHPAALELLGLAGPLAVTSANRSGETPATTVDEARRILGEDVIVYLDGGVCNGESSTVVSLVDGVSVLRSGPITEEEIRALL